jgi:hypothetical protein
VIEGNLEDARGGVENDVEGTRAGHGPVALVELE